VKGEERWHRVKTKVAVAAIKGEETTNQIASRFGIHPGQVSQWKRQMRDNAPLVFERSRKRDKEQQALLDKLYKEIGQLKVERDFLARISKGHGRAGKCQDKQESPVCSFRHQQELFVLQPQAEALQEGSVPHEGN